MSTDGRGLTWSLVCLPISLSWPDIFPVPPVLPGSRLWSVHSILYRMYLWRLGTSTCTCRSRLLKISRLQRLPPSHSHPIHHHPSLKTPSAATTRNLPDDLYPAQPSSTARLSTNALPPTPTYIHNTRVYKQPISCPLHITFRPEASSSRGPPQSPLPAPDASSNINVGPPTDTHGPLHGFAPQAPEAPTCITLPQQAARPAPDPASHTAQPHPVFPTAYCSILDTGILEHRILQEKERPPAAATPGPLHRQRGSVVPPDIALPLHACSSACQCCRHSSPQLGYPPELATCIPFCHLTTPVRILPRGPTPTRSPDPQESHLRPGAAALGSTHEGGPSTVCS